MTIASCQRHGKVLPLLLSSDLRKDFLNKKPPPKLYHLLKVTLYDENHFEHVMVSEDIVNRLTINVDKVFFWEDLRDWDEVKIEAVCGECFDEWLDNDD